MKTFTAHPSVCDDIGRLRGIKQGVGQYFDGWKVVPNEHIPRHPSVWRFPDDEPFIQYEEHDRAWCEYFGLGRSEDDRSRVQVFALTADPCRFEAVNCVAISPGKKWWEEQPVPTGFDFNAFNHRPVY